MADTPLKVCAGPCRRALPADGEHFYRQKPRGLAPRCKECVKAASRERKAAERENAPVRLKRCGGACGRELPANADHFAPDPLDRPRPRCRDCELAAEFMRERDATRAAASAEHRALIGRTLAERQSGTKRCNGPCGRTLPADTEHFHRHARSRSGLQTRCKECLNAEHRDRRAAERELRRPSLETARAEAKPTATGDAEEASARVKAAVRDHFDRELDAACAGLDRLILELTDGQPPLPVTFQTTDGRRNFIRNHVATAPPGGAPDAAARARSMMARCDSAAELTRPPFDASEVFLLMAEDAEDVDTLGAGLRRIGWTP